MDFKDFPSKVLKDIVKKYELHYIKEFEGYTTFGKRELVNKLKKHLYIEGDLIKQKKEPFSMNKPLTTQQKKNKKDEDKLKDFFTKQLEGKDLLIKPLEFSLSKENPEIIKRKTRKDKGIKKGKMENRKEKRSLEEIGIEDAIQKGQKAENKLKGAETVEDLQKIFMEALKGKGKRENKSGYGLHAIIIKNSIPFDEAEKKAKDISKKKKIFVRNTKDSFRFRNIPKTKFEKKTFRSKKIDKDITLVFGKLKPEFVHLEGAGILDWLKSGFEKVKILFNRPDKFNNVSRTTLEKYGDMKINKLTIIRTPIISMIKKALKLIGANIKYDDLFHLGLIAEVEGGKKILLEKNEVINIIDKVKSNDKSQYMEVSYNGELKLNELVNNSMALWNPQYKFFEYNFKTNNCQIFIKNLLKGSNLLTPELEKFIMQDVSDLLGNKGEKVATFITDIAGTFNKIIGGRIAGDEVYTSKDEFMSEREGLISAIDNFKTQLDRIKTGIESNADYQTLRRMELPGVSVRSLPISVLPTRGSTNVVNPLSRAIRSDSTSASAVEDVSQILSPRTARKTSITTNQPQQIEAMPLQLPQRTARQAERVPEPVQSPTKRGIFKRIGSTLSGVVSPSRVQRNQGRRNILTTTPPEEPPMTGEGIVKVPYCEKERNKQKMFCIWVKALKQWNEKYNAGKQWCTPLKGTKEYDEVWKIAGVTPKGKKEEPKKVVSKGKKTEPTKVISKKIISKKEPKKVVSKGKKKNDEKKKDDNIIKDENSIYRQLIRNFKNIENVPINEETFDLIIENNDNPAITSWARNLPKYKLFYDKNYNHIKEFGSELLTYMRKAFEIPEKEEQLKKKKTDDLRKMVSQYNIDISDLGDVHVRNRNEVIKRIIKHLYNPDVKKVSEKEPSNEIKNLYKKVGSYLASSVSKYVKQEFDKLPPKLQMTMGMNKANEYEKKFTNEILKSDKLKKELEKKFKMSEVKNLEKYLSEYETYFKKEREPFFIQTKKLLTNLLN